MLQMEHAQQLFFLNNKQSGWGNSRCGAHSQGLTRHTALTKEVRRPIHSYDSFLARAVHDGQLYPAFLDVHYGFGSVPLRINGFVSMIFRHFSGNPSGVEKGLCIEIHNTSRNCMILWFHIHAWTRSLRTWSQASPNVTKGLSPKLCKTEQRVPHQNS